MLTLNDGRNELWQWDTGRKLTVDADCSQVHFSNKVFGRSVDVDVLDGEASIPDILLQTDKDLIAWAFVGTAENGYTKISKVFKVNRRNKPADYVFTPPEQTSLEEIKEKVEHLESIQDPDAIKNAVEDYLEQNPVDAPVQSVNGKTGKVDLTAKDVGAISQDDLQEATNKALEQAKESGEFDGDDYVLTPADKAEIAEMAADLVDVSDGSSGSGHVVQNTPPEDTSVLWVDPTDNSDDGFQEAVNAALAQAKESGEFDGNDYILTEADKTEIAKQAAELVDVPDSGGGIAVTGAKVGQTVKISAVDENGVPTAWTPADFPSGGGEENWEFINYVKLTEDSGLITFDTDSTGNPFCLKSVMVAIYSVGASANTQEGFLKVVLNGKLALDNAYGIRLPGNTRGVIFVDDEITKNMKTKANMFYGSDEYNPIKNGAIDNNVPYGSYGGLSGTAYRNELPNGVTQISVTSSIPETQLLGIDSEILIWGVRM